MTRATTRSLLKRITSPFVLVLSFLCISTYTYAVLSLNGGWVVQVLLTIPIGFIWIVPVIYWNGRRESHTRSDFDHMIHLASYISMGWLNFFVLSLILVDGLLLVIGFFAFGSKGLGMAPFAPSLSTLYQGLYKAGGPGSLVFALIALFMGMLKASRGPLLKEVELEFQSLPPTVDHFRIVQISDLHVGPTIRRSYVDRVVGQCNALEPDIVVLTGDMVDGSVEDLRDHVAPLAGLKAKHGVFMCLGNHDYYSGSQAWTKHWTDELNVIVLRNEHVVLDLDKNCRIKIAGVTDPASILEGPGEEPNPSLAKIRPYRTPSIGLRANSDPFPTQDDVTGSHYHLNVMLAHNPKLAGAVALEGFDLQLSGHTHAGQFLPWTWATKLIHAPHYAGLSREGKKLMVYVNSGTGSWGPPLRFGTSTELTLLKLARN